MSTLIDIATQPLLSSQIPITSSLTNILASQEAKDIDIGHTIPSRVTLDHLEAKAIHHTNTYRILAQSMLIPSPNFHNAIYLTLTATPVM